MSHLSLVSMLRKQLRPSDLRRTTDVPWCGSSGCVAVELTAGMRSSRQHMSGWVAEAEQSTDQPSGAEESGERR